jgi:hypothetical protein
LFENLYEDAEIWDMKVKQLKEIEMRTKCSFHPQVSTVSWMLSERDENYDEFIDWLHFEGSERKKKKFEEREY